MSDEPQQLSDDQLDVLLDQRDPDRIAAMARQYPQAADRIELQSRIDASLQRQFVVSEPSDEHVADLLRYAETTALRRDPGVLTSRRKRALSIAWITVAAAAVWAMVAWQLGRSPTVEPSFTPRALVEIYQESVAKGFEPYYECEDADRFAATFATRQGQPLRLAQMPDDKIMLGLSYPGGLSRRTTAMLCRVNDRPVIVFVDVVTADRTPQTAKDGLHVFRAQRDGLVFYEVSEFTEPQVTEYLEPLHGDS